MHSNVAYIEFVRLFGLEIEVDLCPFESYSPSHSFITRSLSSLRNELRRPDSPERYVGSLLQSMYAGPVNCLSKRIVN